MANLCQAMLRQIAPDLNPAGVEASMRLEHGTLDHLSRNTFEKGAIVARAIERAAPGHLKGLAHLMGLGADHDEWEAAKAAPVIDL